jgi:hypothetical protein
MDERVDVFVHPVQALSQHVQHLGAGLEIGRCAGGTGQQVRDVLSGQPGWSSFLI